MKDEYYIDKVKKCDVKDLLNTFHYLKDESKDFKVSPYSYGYIETMLQMFFILVVVLVFVYLLVFQSQK